MDVDNRQSLLAMSWKFSDDVHCLREHIFGARMRRGIAKRFAVDDL